MKSEPHAQDTLSLIGTVITDPAVGRDAVHIAVAPLVAPRELRPGERLAGGLVDPFLTRNVQPHERFLLFLYPQTVTSLRHVWSAPGWADEALTDDGR